MMEEEFYATLKLVTGEELIAKVSYMPDEDSLLVDNPMIVERIIQKRGNRAIEGFHLKEWMTATYETMFVVKMKQVVTITELDKKIAHFYEKHLELDGEIPTNVNGKGLTKQMGYLGSVKQTKIMLEKIFNNS
tara:strand:- start:8341 stop:8739 length:399 start_codon:yes stop_codon:yes gene_type:complete